MDFFTGVETSFRIFLRALDPTACNNGTGPFNTIYDCLLGSKQLNFPATERAAAKELLNLSRLLRNHPSHGSVGPSRWCHSGGRPMLHQRKTQLRCFFLQVIQFSVLLLLLVSHRSEVVILNPMLEHVIHRSGNFMSRGYQRRHRSQVSLLPAVIRSKHALAPGDRCGGLAKGLPSAVIGRQRATA